MAPSLVAVRGGEVDEREKEEERMGGKVRNGCPIRVTSPTRGRRDSRRTGTKSRNNLVHRCRLNRVDDKVALSRDVMTVRKRFNLVFSCGRRRGAASAMLWADHKLHGTQRTSSHLCSTLSAARTFPASRTRGSCRCVRRSSVPPRHVVQLIVVREGQRRPEEARGG